MGSSLSCDLVGYVNNHLSLLYHVSRCPFLTSPDGNLLDVITRYQNFMTLRSYGLAQSTPLDVEWIWHVHRLHPVEYIKDCMSAFGKVIPSQFTKVKIETEKEDLLKHFYLTTYECATPLSPEDAKLFRFKPSINLVDAAVKQQGFLEQANYLYGGGPELFRKFEKDYIMFLKLFKKVKNQDVLVPTIGIDLIWHTHMRFPEHYADDTKRVIGHILDHNDDIPATALLRHSFTTSQRWSREYGKAYDKSNTNISNKAVWESRSFLDGSFYPEGGWEMPPHSVVGDFSPILNCTISGAFICGGSLCGGISVNVSGGSESGGVGCF
jgi:hypothetical protein